MLGDAVMNYRAYLIDAEGHISRRVDLVCVDDEAAKERARQLVDGHDVELWRLGDMVAVFKHKETPHP